MAILNFQVPIEVKKARLPSMLEIVDKLDQLSISDFHLTGSRFFGGITNESDYDFMTEYSELTKEALISFGFKGVQDENYNALNSSDELFRIECADGHVDVQLIKDLQLKLQIQGRIKHMLCIGADPIWPNLSKEDKKAIWRDFYRFSYGILADERKRAKDHSMCRDGKCWVGALFDCPVCMPKPSHEVIAPYSENDHTTSYHGHSTQSKFLRY